MRKILFPFFSVTLALGLTLGAGELAARAYYNSNAYLRSHVGRALVLDDELGWRAAPGYHNEGLRRDAADAPYPLNVTLDERGFRVYRRPAETGRPFLLLVVGDSFTQALHASNDRTYYARLHQQLGVDVEAYGGGAYGTLQEYMILDRYLDALRPNGVLLQLHANDVINNDYEMEVRSAGHNSHLRRPYLMDDGRIVYAFPLASHPLLVWLREAANRHSRLLYHCLSVIDRYQAQAGLSDHQQALGDADAILRYQHALHTTGRLLQKIRARVPTDVPVWAFVARGEQPYLGDLANLCRGSGLIYLDGVAQTLDAAETSGVVTRASDKDHWNERGHELAAGVLIDALRPQLPAFGSSSAPDTPQARP